MAIHLPGIAAGWKTNPAEFGDAEIIKAKLEAIEAGQQAAKEQLDRIEGHLEALMAAIEGMDK